MKLEKRKPSGREKDEASVKLLDKLREKLYSDDSSTRRWAAFNLSWLQEDGLDILKEALFSDCSKATKNATAYGLRSMRGRMRKMALEVFKQGSKHRDSTTKEVCKMALLVIGKKAAGKPPSLRRKRQTGKYVIKEIPSKTRKKGKARDRKGKAHTRN